jgi:single-stranded DNA-binding protein
MIKMFVTNALISKGFEGVPAMRFSDRDETSLVTFRIGMRIYDKRAKDNHRWINLNVKGFNYACERIRSMKLDAGSYVNIIGRYDEDAWEDQTTQERRSAPVLIIDEIEYGSNNQNGNGKQTRTENGNAAPAANGQRQVPAADGDNRQNDNFTGFESFGGTNPYFPES